MLCIDGGGEVTKIAAGDNECRCTSARSFRALTKQEPGPDIVRDLWNKAAEVNGICRRQVARVNHIAVCQRPLHEMLAVVEGPIDLYGVNIAAECCHLLFL